MASEMIERVARAIHNELYGSDVMWRESVPAARAAIEAMKDPTESMVGAGIEMDGLFSEASTRTAIQMAYDAMIDAALSEQEG